MLRRRITKLPNLVGRKSTTKEEPKTNEKDSNINVLKNDNISDNNKKQDITTINHEVETTGLNKHDEETEKNVKVDDSRNFSNNNQSHSNDNLKNINDYDVVTEKNLNNVQTHSNENVKITNSYDVTTERNIMTNDTTNITVKTGQIDMEHPPPPVSPSKFNRARIKAIPRLGQQRKTSFSMQGSASESEDDGNRRRNDSICSVNSTHVETNQDSTIKREIAIPSNRNPQKHYKKRSEQSRKFAEARREFQMKLREGKFDKQKLTMFDLIFYNPTTNLMSDKTKKESPPSQQEIEENEKKIIIEIDENEEDVDNPEKVNDEAMATTATKESDDDNNGILAPQIKIGSNGEIVVDEKSLIIENIETKRNREALQSTKIIDGDLQAGYGFYKRVKRTKTWSNLETKRFYKALNTLGTDFSIMTELFPNRTRRELKMKFKKEERVNKQLIDKAIMEPLRFNIDELRREVELDIEMTKLKQNDKEEELARKNEKKNKKSNERRKLNIKGVRSEDNIRDIKKKKRLKLTKKRKRKTSYDYLQGGIDSVLTSDDDETNYNSSDNDINMDFAYKPTRSGRIPKRNKTITEICAENQRRHDDIMRNRTENQEEIVSPPPTPEPGSILISSTKNSEGSVVYKIFMVTSPNENEDITAAPSTIVNNEEIHTTIEHNIESN